MAEQQGHETNILSAITTLKSRLADIIEPDFGLLDDLLTLGVLSYRQFARVCSERTVYERNDALLDLLTTEEQCRKLLTALQRASQQHVVNFVTQKGDIGAEYGDVRPLDEARVHALTRNRVQLLDRVDCNTAFIDELGAVGCITWPQRERIVNILQPRDRNDKLLEFLTRRSVADFQKFIHVLAKDQAHLVPLMITDGVVIGMDAELDESSVDDVTECEEKIVIQSRVLLSVGSRAQIQQKVDELDELSRSFGLQTRLVVMERANSIALYFICMALSAVMGLRDQWRSRQLRDIVQKLFTFLSGATRAVVVKRLTWSLTDYERCVDFFRVVQEERSTSDVVELSECTLSVKNLSDLPLGMSERVLMRAFLMLYSSDIDDADHRQYQLGKSRNSERRAYTMLCSVCWDLWQTMAGWQQSPTGHWLRHQLKKLIERSCRPFKSTARMKYMYKLDYWNIKSGVVGVTQLRDVVYMVCYRSSAILRFDASTHQRLPDIDVKDMKEPQDIAACEQTSLLYAPEYHKGRGCVWRLSANSSDMKRWQPKSPDDTFRPRTLSVTSTRLLLTSEDTNQMIQFDAFGNELRRVQLPDDKELHHAVESPTGTFIVSLLNRQLKQWQVAEVNTGGEVLRQFSGSQSLGVTPHIAVDYRGNILVANFNKRRILLLDAQLSLRRVIVDEHQLIKRPGRLCYREQSGQLLVGLDWGNSVAVFDVLSR